MGHDQRFKEFLHAFLRDFLRLFFPDVEKQLDFRSLEFLDPGVFTDRPEGMPREADVVAKLETRNGDPALVLIHVEVQLRPHPDFGARMHEYYTLLCSCYKLPVLPFALFLRGGKKGLGTQEYVRTLLGRNVNQFRYESVHLARLGVEEYGGRGGPAGAGLAALMDRSTIGDVERLRASLMRRVVQGELDEERGMEKGLEQGREQGLEQGREVGLLEGKREALLRCLAVKFGALPDRTTSHVRAIESVDELHALLERVVVVASLEEMGL